MIINGINFPNEIIDSIQENKLVIFVGAGVSIGEPTCLPDFNKLADEIAIGSGLERGTNEPCDSFLGKLKFRKINVNGIAAEKLSNLNLMHNELHKHIINIFSEDSKIKVVTTNYDQMLEQVIEEKGSKVKVYNSPALPIGNNITGVIHIHGNIDDSQYMVLTDEDFGKAYLVDGYVSRFLVKLFETYMVLFIGYSYNDVIMRYLTRAMVNDGMSKRYIMTDDNLSDWQQLGIIPIIFPKGDFLCLYKGIELLGEKVIRKPSDWKIMFETVDNKPPIDYSEESEIEFCLENKDTSYLLMDIIHGEEWLWWLDKRNKFDKIFSGNAVLEEIDYRWLEWIINEFAAKNSLIIERLIIKHNGYHTVVAGTICKEIVLNEKKYSDELVNKYVGLFSDEIKDKWLILKLIEVLTTRNNYKGAWKLFQRFYDCKIFPKDSWITATGEGVDFELSFLGDEFHVDTSWKAFGKAALDEFPYDIIEFGRCLIIKIHDQFSMLNLADDEKEPWKLQEIPIEEKDKHRYSDDILLKLIMIMEAAFYIIELKRGEYIKEYIWNCFDSNSVLLKKVAFKFLRKCKVINVDEKASILIDQFNLYSYTYKEQIYLLTAEIFDKISEENQFKIVEPISCGKNTGNKDSDAYEKFNWCVWLKQKCKDNIQICKIMEEVKKGYPNFIPRPYPELSMVFSDIKYGDESPVTEQEMINMSTEELIKSLIEYKSDNFEGPNREGLLSVFSACIKKNYEWTIKLIPELKAKIDLDSDVWNRIFNSITYSEYTAMEKYTFLIVLDEEKYINKYYKEISRLIEKILKNAEKQEIVEYKADILHIASYIIDSKFDEDQKYSGRAIDLCFNSASGISVSSIMKLYSVCEDETECLKYLNLFESLLNDERNDKKAICCSIAGQFNFLFNRNKEWCKNNVLPLLYCENDDLYSAAWEGYIFFSGYLAHGKEREIQMMYLDAVGRMHILSKDTRHRFPVD